MVTNNKAVKMNQNGGLDLLTELQEIISKDPEQIEDSAFKRLMLTAQLATMRQLKNLNDNPAVWLGDVIRMHPKLSLFILLLIIIFFMLPELRSIILALLGIEPDLLQHASPTTVIVTAIP